MEPARPIIRLLAASDAPAYASLRLSAIDEAPESFLSTRVEEEKRSIGEIEARICSTANQVVFGAFAGDRLVAVAGLRRYPLRPVQQKGFLWGLFVVQEHRRSGIARSLIAAAVEQARAMGLAQIALNTGVDNAGAIALYRSAGFEAVEDEPCADEFDGDADQEVEMVLRLG
ncbi:GNAT family N-acetyltransferase [Paraburkholderia azotifigens]|uniref:GNAT family N-acetyltransferase n=1 Tax=Paraburkholderia azotifigens TaxID=2057004 RepID=A0A5C6V157_9BURK|nr:GNAT family N-acetyltransferase [Paraburkholderia azotifigens]TXC79157.1 GNAT family N-acetyltransferase [Paraburkholderia azotifigens]